MYSLFHLTVVESIRRTYYVVESNNYSFLLLKNSQRLIIILNKEVET